MDTETLARKQRSHLQFNCILCAISESHWIGSLAIFGWCIIFSSQINFPESINVLWWRGWAHMNQIFVFIKPQIDTKREGKGEERMRVFDVPFKICHYRWPMFREKHRFYFISSKSNTVSELATDRLMCVCVWSMRTYNGTTAQI